MPSAATTSHSPYDNDAVERDLIDPDDGTLQCSHHVSESEANGQQLRSTTWMTLSRRRRTARR
jgi:hypothetical protein